MGIFGLSVGIEQAALLIIVFVLFLIITRKIVGVLFNILWIAGASAAFPFVMRFLGFGVPTDINSAASFIVLGIGLYFVYILGRVVYALLGFAEKTGKAIAYPVTSIKKRRDEKTRKKMEKFANEKESKTRKDS